MKLLRTACLALTLPRTSLTSLPCLAQDAATDWSVTIGQDGQQQPTAQTVRLKKAPFSISFVGHKDMVFAALSQHRCAPLQAILANNQMGDAVRGTNIAAEGSAAQGNDLVVNQQSKTNLSFNEHHTV